MSIDFRKNEIILFYINADFAEAIMAMPAENGEESGIVKQVYVKGYKKGDKVLRYAQVIVTQ